MTLPLSAPPPETLTPLRTALPADAVNAHVHPVGDDFPLWDKAVERPQPGTLDVWLDRFRSHQSALGCTRAVMVHSILYGPDNAITLEAVRRMGPGHVAVVLVRDGATEDEIAALAQAGARAVRLNYVHGGLLSWEGMRSMAPMLAAHGLHVEMLAHSHLHLSELAPQVADLPVEVVFDHAAWPDPALGVTDGQKALERLLAEGQAWTKLSAAYRHTPEPGTLFRRLAEANPERLLWGSDWPHLMLGAASMPDAGTELNTLLDALPDTATQNRIFTENPARLYRFDS
ncbi:amidohydrolase family protein [Mameliella sediminis]|uniref:amidohydrolase family protein n=1 Tax=Mameliella sediminis TaxID=2836866 RepID=UPI001C45E25B|nr:amidohydrolase family protein [Mameliella sediminis]MBV7396819.1 amidohydrolase family protein [Mameliella sediminis]MBY6161845.1 amidohydrolase family protein [Mameliella alba]MBY6170315.1 amidohydrolase family protein [Mameliella alba]MBY6175334.1 amidohydrolase family protein [Mameliella alba]